MQSMSSSSSGCYCYSPSISISLCKAIITFPFLLLLCLRNGRLLKLTAHSSNRISRALCFMSILLKVTHCLTVCPSFYDKGSPSCSFNLKGKWEIPPHPSVYASVTSYSRSSTALFTLHRNGRRTWKEVLFQSDLKMCLYANEPWLYIFMLCCMIS